MDYSTYQYDTPTTTDSSEGLSAVIGAGLILFYLALLALIFVAMWKLFSKAGKPGWAAIVPIYNTIVVLQIVGRPIWWILLMLVPLVNIVVGVIVANDLVKSFGKTVGWTVGLILLPIIFYPMLAFGSAKYVGPVVTQKK